MHCIALVEIDEHIDARLVRALDAEAQPIGRHRRDVRLAATHEALEMGRCDARERRAIRTAARASDRIDDPMIVNRVLCARAGLGSCWGGGRDALDAAQCLTARAAPAFGTQVLMSPPSGRRAPGVHYLPHLRGGKRPLYSIVSGQSRPTRDRRDSDDDPDDDRIHLRRRSRCRDPPL